MTAPQNCCICGVTGDPSVLAADRDGCCGECWELLRWFRSYLEDVPEQERAAIKPATTFRELSFDSLDHVNWVVEAHYAFDVRIPDRDAERLHTVGEFLARLSREGARWSPSQDIQILKRSWGRRDGIIVDRDEPRSK